jgi:hypothetical protein
LKILEVVSKKRKETKTNNLGTRSGEENGNKFAKASAD